ncbi:hypothetical protein B0J18DRAFT_396132 [Chaetomium sp. MPI-SDFR-AT-0129]|nr:hypothetical protein B0J18DRAFT_396132 [Chaetomium sp. MPI-SDFR-AT-0129]
MRTRRAARTSLLFSPHLFVPYRYLAADFSYLPATIPRSAPALRPTLQLFRRSHTLDARTKAKLALSTDIAPRRKPLFHYHQIQTERKVARKLPSTQSGDMDPDQSRGWRPQGQGGHPTPGASNGSINPFGMPFGATQSNPNWAQQTPQQSFPQPSGPFQRGNGNDRGRQNPFGPPVRPQDNGGSQHYSPYGQPPFQAPFGRPAWGDRSGHRNAGSTQFSGASRPYQGDSYRPGPRFELFGDFGDCTFASDRPRPQYDTFRSGQTDSYRPADPFRMPPQRDNEHNDQTDQPPRRRRNRRKRDGSAPQAPRPRRAPAPQWHFPVGHPLADAPKSSSSIGPFHATTPMLGKSGSKSRPGDGDAATEGNIPKEPSSPSQQRGKRDLITPPSAQSGGVPDPTAEYLEQAALPPANPLSKPQPLLVVLDLNGTVIYRKGHKKGSGQFSLRPFAQTFLELCLDRHHLVIWSSARPETVRAICAQLFSRVHRKRILAIWARDRFGLTTADYNLRTQCYKRLTRVWADPVIAGGHPRAAKGGRWSQANTVLIDDSIEKARSEPHNAVTLPEFNGNVDEKPLVLELVAEYLQTLALQKDVSAYIRAQPFAVKGQREESVPASQSESQGEESQGGGEVVMKED